MYENCIAVYSIQSKLDWIYSDIIDQTLRIDFGHLLDINSTAVVRFYGVFDQIGKILWGIWSNWYDSMGLLIKFVNVINWFTNLIKLTHHTCIRFGRWIWWNLWRNWFTFMNLVNFTHQHSFKSGVSLITKKSDKFPISYPVFWLVIGARMQNLVTWIPGGWTWSNLWEI